MLPLDDPLWTKLDHAYGSAEDIPRVLARLLRGKRLRKDYWNGLWGALCHQFTVYTASYAALPHLVSAAGRLTGKRRFQAMALACGIVACSANGKSPRMPPKLSKPFREAVALGREVLSGMILDSRKSTNETIHVLAMIAAFVGQPQVTGCLWTLLGPFQCPECHNEFKQPVACLCPF